MVQHKNIRAAKAAVKDCVAASVYYRDQNGRLMIYTKQKHGAEFIFSHESIYTRYYDQCCGR